MEKRPEIKTFPLHVQDEWIERVGKAAKKQGKSKKDFILDAADEKLREVEGENE